LHICRSIDYLLGAVYNVTKYGIGIKDNVGAGDKVITQTPEDRMIDKKAPLIISIIALIVSVISLVYGIVFQERGILLGHKAYFIAPVKKIKIGNDVRGLYIEMDLSLHNTGTVPVMCNKIEAFLKLNKEEYVFTSSKSFSLQPKQIYSEEVTFCQQFPSEVQKDRDTIMMAAAHDVLVKYHREKNNASPILVSSDFYQRMVDALKANTKWLSADDPYLLLVTFWINTTSESEEPSNKVLYKFTLDREMIRLITDSNIEGNKTPDFIKNNEFVRYYVIPKVTPVPDKSSIDTVYGSYRNLKVAK